MAEDIPKSATTHLKLNPRARDVVDNLRQDTGVPQTESLVRILEWFASQSVEFRLAVLNRNEDARRRLLKTVVDEMAGGAPDDASLPATIPQALTIIRRMVARIDAIETGRSANDEEAQRTKKPRASEGTRGR